MSHVLSYTETRDRMMKQVKWETIESVMKHLNWTWATTAGKVPTIDQMKNCVEHLFDNVWHKMHAEGNTDEWYSASTGGFEVRVVTYSSGKLKYEAIFKIM